MHRLRPRISRDAVESLVSLGPIGNPAVDFAYRLKAGVAHLNHGAFGAPPEPVRLVEKRLRDAWYEFPDSWCFGGRLEAQMQHTCRVVAAELGVSSDEVAVLGNATDAAVTVAQRWSKLLAQDPSMGHHAAVMVLDLGYKSNLLAVDAICGREQVVQARIPFPLQDAAQVVDSVQQALRQHRPRFALLDHIVSKTGMVLPIHDLVQVCRAAGVEEVAVDAAHGFMLSDPGLPSLQADWWWANVHKWGFAPQVATVIWGQQQHLLETNHPIVSWHAGRGLQAEASWTGTRDYTAALTVPAALEYRRRWRSSCGLDHAAFNSQGMQRAASMLRESWGTAAATPQSMNGAMIPVQVPWQLSGIDLQERLREEFHVAVDVADLGTRGCFIRLSHAVYNTFADFERLRDAVNVLTAMH